MKTRFFVALVTLGAALPWLRLDLQGQMSPRPLLKVHVPFEFSVGGMTLPEGDYDVLHLINPNWILLRSGDGRAAATVVVRVSPTSAAEAATRLVFNRYGDHNFLWQIWTAQGNEVHECTISGAERTVARRSQQAPQVAIVYARP